jgi:hypothetical protein
VPAPQKATSGKRKPRWLHTTLKDAQENVENPKRIVRESKAPKRFCSYMALMSSIRESKPSTYEEADRTIGLEGCHGGRVCFHHEE